MRIAATKLTAALTGAWTAFGMSTYTMWSKHQGLDVTSHNVGFVLAGLVFLFVPALLFVAGSQWLKFGIRDTFTARYWHAFGQVGIRGLCWFLGAGAFGLVYWPFLEWLYAN